MADGQLIEAVADEIDDVAEHVEDIATVTRSLTKRDMGFFITGAGIGATVGFAIGYRVLEKRLEKKFSDLLTEEISELKEHYQKKVMVSEPKPPIDKVVEERRYDEREQQAIDETNAKFPAEEEEAVEVSEVQESVQANVFDNPDWSYATEVKGRLQNPGVPYIIHVDEFNQNEPEHTQITYTYYEQDDILADVRDEVIDDMDATIGLGNLGRWGHGSQDANIVYVRNERLTLDIEICRDPGSYAETTHRNLRHSQDRRRRPNRRFEDD